MIKTLKLTDRIIAGKIYSNKKCYQVSVLNFLLKASDIYKNENEITAEWMFQYIEWFIIECRIQRYDNYNDAYVDHSKGWFKNIKQ